MVLLVDFINRQFIHEPPEPTTSFKGRTAIITGSNVGLGLEAARSMISRGASKVILACRNVEKGEAAAKDIQSTTSCSPDALEVWQLDMSSYASVLAFAVRVNIELPRLDSFNANAGMLTTKFRMTEDNEETITTNVVSTTLLGFLIHPKLSETAQKYNVHTHFTITGSELYEVAKFKERKAPAGKIFATLNDQSKAKLYMGDRYNVSKLLVMFAFKQLASISPFASSGVIVNCVAPGFCQSSLGREYDFRGAKTIEKMLARPTHVGARTLVYGASAGPETHGQYLPDCKITELKGLCKGDEGAQLQNRVWLELRDKLEAIRPGVTSLS